MSDEKVRLALEADIPSESEDERFGLPDDSDLDKDYRPPSDDESEMDIGCFDKNDSYELEQVTLTIGVGHSRIDASTVESEPASKREEMKRKRWQWNKYDLPHSSVPLNKLE